MGLGLVVRLAVWLGLLTAAGELAARAAGKFWANRPFSYTYQMVWMTPLADVILVMLFGALVWVLLRVAPRWRQPVVVAGALSFPLWLTAATYAPRVHLWAQAIVAVGLAAQTGRLLAPRFEAFTRLVRRTLPPLAGLAVLGAIAAEGSVAWREWRISRSLPEPPVAAPNVLLLIWDTVRASSLSAFGYDVPTTPGLEKLAASGVLFERAVSTASWTLPSHGSLFTGRPAHQLNTNWRTPLDDTDRTLAEVFTSAGYRTGGFAANRFYVRRAYGLDRGFTHFDEVHTFLGEVVRSAAIPRIVAGHQAVRRITGYDDTLGRPRGTMMAERLLRWLRGGDQSRPYFAFVNFMDAHAPYLPTAPFDTAFGWYAADTPAAERRRLRRISTLEFPDISREDARHQRYAYEGAIAQLDAITQQLLSELERDGLLRNTLVIVASDHGEEFDEHGFFGHGNTLFLQSLHVPLVMSFPGRLPMGRRVEPTVSLRDLPATILDLVGLPSTLPGVSLRPLWTGDSANVSPALAEVRYEPGVLAGSPLEAGDMHSIVTDSLQVIRNGNGEHQVFDLRADPTGGTPAPPGTDISALQRLLPHSGATVQAPAGRDDRRTAHNSRPADPPR